jgi:hypothetical protein
MVLKLHKTCLFLMQNDGSETYEVTKVTEPFAETQVIKSTGEYEYSSTVSFIIMQEKCSMLNKGLLIKCFIESTEVHLFHICHSCTGCIFINSNSCYYKTKSHKIRIHN